MGKITHTPLPWSRNLGTNEIFSGDADDYVGQIPIIEALELSDEDAIFITTACNSHYELLEAVEAADNFIMRGGTALQGLTVHDQLWAALDKAKGGTP